MNDEYASPRGALKPPQTNKQTSFFTASLGPASMKTVRTRTRTTTTTRTNERTPRSFFASSSPRVSQLPTRTSHASARVTLVVH